MPSTFRRLHRATLARKRCLRCGFDGPELQRELLDFCCPHCGQDLYARPPRTYFELEGLRELASPARPRKRFRLRRVLRSLRGLLGLGSRR